MEIDADIEEIVLYQVAQKVLENLPEDKMRKILEASLAKTLHEIMRPWDVQKVIEKDVNKYMADYLIRPEVQEKIKLETEQAVDNLMRGVIYTIIYNSQEAFKSQYKHFVEKPEEKD